MASRANRNQRLGGRAWVYFAQRADGPVKIGFSRQVSQRIKALGTSCPEGVALLGTIADSDATEKDVHARFAKHRIKGEWFQPAPEILELAEAGKAIYANGYVAEIPAELDWAWRRIVRLQLGLSTVGG